MNRYPLWKYAVMLVALVIGLVYTLPNFFGETPAVQVSSGKATVKVTPELFQQIEQTLSANQIAADDISFDNNPNNPSVRIRLNNTDTQLRTKDLLSKTLNADPSDP